LRYNEDLDGYELNLTDEQLKGASVSETGFYETAAPIAIGSVDCTITIGRRRTGKPGEKAARRCAQSPRRAAVRFNIC